MNIVQCESCKFNQSYYVTVDDTKSTVARERVLYKQFACALAEFLTEQDYKDKNCRDYQSKEVNHV